jgi:endogenous inhibitor of DNA gyrase (YacG/DUF329 family)
MEAVDAHGTKVWSGLEIAPAVAEASIGDQQNRMGLAGRRVSNGRRASGLASTPHPQRPTESCPYCGRPDPSVRASPLANLARLEARCASCGTHTLRMVESSQRV